MDNMKVPLGFLSFVVVLAIGIHLTNLVPMGRALFHKMRSGVMRRYYEPKQHHYRPYQDHRRNQYDRHDRYNYHRQHVAKNYREAIEMGRKYDKLIVLDFYASWCRWCHEMDNKVWNNRNVKVALSNYIFAKIDIDRYPSVARKYNVQSVPAVKIIDCSGSIVNEVEGYISPNRMEMFLNYPANQN